MLLELEIEGGAIGKELLVLSMGIPTVNPAPSGQIEAY